jgi:hypothetical protein
MKHPTVFAISCGLRIKGDALDPDEISAALGIRPTYSHKKGEIVRPERAEPFVRRNGVWSLIVDADGPHVEDALSAALDRLGSIDQDLSRLPNVEAADFDIFATADVAHAGIVECSFVLKTADVQKLAKLHVPVQVTVSFSVAKEGAAVAGSPPRGDAE